MSYKRFYNQYEGKVRISVRKIHIYLQKGKKISFALRQ